MRRFLLWFTALSMVGRPGLMRSQELRVELFSGQAVSSLEVQAGSERLRLCALHRPDPCLVVEPRESAQCVSVRTALRCTSRNSSRKFHNVYVYSAAPFRVCPGFGPSKRGGPPLQLGAVEVTVLQNRLRIVARTDLNTYLAGVLAGEAAVLRSPAARAAMAILARTWALRWRGRHRGEGFDFCSLTHCQAFRFPSSTAGAPSTAFSDGAVRATQGQVLTYRGSLVDPYFSANCGGVTEAAADVWPDRAQPYLVSVRDPYCAGSDQASWQRVLSPEVVTTILREDLGLPLDGVGIGLTIEKQDSSGRVHTLRAMGSGGWRLDANQFRYAANRRLGWATLKSNLYTLDRHGDSLVFSGRGLGHGVGLCQAGTEQMGRMGFSSEQILAAYFPGTAVGRVKAAESDPMISSEHFELAYPESQQPWAEQSLEALENFHRELGKYAEALSGRIRVQTWSTTEEFIRATGQPGWAAANNDGHAISLQPLGLLDRKGILKQTLRHELTHLVVHRLGASQVPHWYEEGLVLYLTHEQIRTGHNAATPRPSLEKALSNPRSEAEMRTAYAEALGRVQALARERGEPTLWRVLQRPEADDLRWLRAFP